LEEEVRIGSIGLASLGVIVIRRHLLHQTMAELRVQSAPCQLVRMHGGAFDSSGLARFHRWLGAQVTAVLAGGGLPSCLDRTIGRKHAANAGSWQSLHSQYGPAVVGGVGDECFVEVTNGALVGVVDVGGGGVAPGVVGGDGVADVGAGVAAILAMVEDDEKILDVAPALGDDVAVAGGGGGVVAAAFVSAAAAGGVVVGGGVVVVGDVVGGDVGGVVVVVVDGVVVVVDGDGAVLQRVAHTRDPMCAEKSEVSLTVVDEMAERHVVVSNPPTPLRLYFSMPRLHWTSQEEAVPWLQQIAVLPRDWQWLHSMATMSMKWQLHGYWV
jgi:hypothetical protein